MKKVMRVEYKDAYGNPQEATVGKSNVVEIVEHSAQGEGDKWYYDIVFDGGDTFRVFDPIFVALTPNE